jgi:hypothetical protein
MVWSELGIVLAGHGLCWSGHWLAWAGLFWMFQAGHDLGTIVAGLGMGLVGNGLSMFWPCSGHVMAWTGLRLGCAGNGLVCAWPGNRLGYAWAEHGLGSA